MPVVLTDKTNKVWATEDPVAQLLIIGYTGQAGIRILDLLDFAQTRHKQFMQFVERRREADRLNEERLSNAQRQISAKSTDA